MDNTVYNICGVKFVDMLCTASTGGSEDAGSKGVNLVACIQEFHRCFLHDRSKIENPRWPPK